jgi:hypothetical protein
VSETAWAAGIFDGEGCVTWTNGRHNKTLRLSVSQSGSPEIPARFGAAVGFGRLNGPYYYKKNRKAQYQWNVNGAEAHAVMELLWPWLSSPKRDKYAAIKDEVL